MENIKNIFRHYIITITITFSVLLLNSCDVMNDIIDGFKDFIGVSSDDPIDISHGDLKAIGFYFHIPEAITAHNNNGEVSYYTSVYFGSRGGEDLGCPFIITKDETGGRVWTKYETECSRWYDGETIQEHFIFLFKYEGDENHDGTVIDFVYGGTGDQGFECTIEALGIPYAETLYADNEAIYEITGVEVCSAIQYLSWSNPRWYPATYLYDWDHCTESSKLSVTIEYYEE